MILLGSMTLTEKRPPCGECASLRCYSWLQKRDKHAGVHDSKSNPGRVPMLKDEYMGCLFS